MSSERLQAALDDLARGRVSVPPEDMIFADDGGYPAESKPVPKPGGCLFLFDGPKPQQGVAPHLKCNIGGRDSPCAWYVEGMPPLSAVFYAEHHPHRPFRGLISREPEIGRGRWRGEAGPWFRDMVPS